MRRSGRHALGLDSPTMIKHLVLAASLAFATLPAFAHEARVGDVEIVHPYAVPSVPGASNGAAYIAALENTGKATDRLLRASTPVAARVELHTMSVDAQGVMRMREIEAIELAPGAKVTMQPGMGLHLMLVGLKQPLKAGDSFPITLEFAKAGKVELKLGVQAPKGAAEMHKH